MEPVFLYRQHIGEMGCAIIYVILKKKRYSYGRETDYEIGDTG